MYSSDVKALQNLLLYFTCQLSSITLMVILTTSFHEMSGSRASKIDTLYRTDKNKIYVTLQQSTRILETSCNFLNVEVSDEECGTAQVRMWGH